MRSSNSGHLSQSLGCGSLFFRKRYRRCSLGRTAALSRCGLPCMRGKKRKRGWRHFGGVRPADWWFQQHYPVLTGLPRGCKFLWEMHFFDLASGFQRCQGVDIASLLKLEDVPGRFQSNQKTEVTFLFREECPEHHRFRKNFQP